MKGTQKRRIHLAGENRMSYKLQSLVHLCMCFCAWSVNFEIKNTCQINFEMPCKKVVFYLLSSFVMNISFDTDELTLTNIEDFELSAREPEEAINTNVDDIIETTINPIDSLEITTILN